MWLNKFKTELQERLLHFLWRQWAQLGVASANTEAHDGWAIDPEALWLFSSTLARNDARLFDEIMDWLVKNSSFLNFPRLKSLSRKLALGHPDVTSAMADAVRQHNSRLSWRSKTPEGGNEKASLFTSDGMSNLDFGHRDKTFLRYGFTRGRLELRGMSRLFNPVMPECSVLRLRSLLGISARAEIVLYLLTHRLGHPSHIARETGFSQKNVQDTLVDMSASGVVQVCLMNGRKKSYFINKEDSPSFLPPNGKPPRWIPWPALLKALELLVMETSRLDADILSERLLASELRRISSAIRPHVEASGFADTLTNPRPYSGEAYIPVFRGDMNNLLAYVDA